MDAHQLEHAIYWSIKKLGLIICLLNLEFYVFDLVFPSL